MINYGNVYVASVAIGADKNQFLKAIKEAEEYDGPALIIGYCVCTGHNLVNGMETAQKQMKDAVKSGFWSLWRYNPLQKNNFPFKLDYSKKPQGITDFLKSEGRFNTLLQAYPDQGKKLQLKLQNSINDTYEKLLNFSKMKNI
jgi:pyruvate-ferredoxin/flavodoxin oxidoreductase